MYMPAIEEEAFRTHGDQPARPTTVTQRLTFQGFSQQDTPPEAGDPALDKPANVFSPNTLHKTVGEQLAPPDQMKKKQRTRSNKKGASVS